MWAVCRSKHGVCPDVGATLVSNGTHGIALGGGRTPNPPRLPDPPDVTVVIDPGVSPTPGRAALLGDGTSPDPGTPLDPPVPPNPDAPPVALNKPQCHHSTPLVFLPWPLLA